MLAHIRTLLRLDAVGSLLRLLLGIGGAVERLLVHHGVLTLAVNNLGRACRLLLNNALHVVLDIARCGSLLEALEACRLRVLRVLHFLHILRVRERRHCYQCEYQECAKKRKSNRRLHHTVHTVTSLIDDSEVLPQRGVKKENGRPFKTLGQSYHGRKSHARREEGKTGNGGWR